MNRVMQYHNVQIMTADPVRIVIMLYDGVVRFNKLAQNAMHSGNVADRNASINRSLEIIGELSTSLNMEEGGEIAMNLSRLYDFCQASLTEANRLNSPAKVEEVTRVISEVKAGWEAIANDRARRTEEPARSISCGA